MSDDELREGFEAGMKTGAAKEAWEKIDDISRARVMNAFPAFAGAAHEVVAARQDIAAAEDSYDDAMERLTAMTFEVMEPLMNEQFDSWKARADVNDPAAAFFGQISDALNKSSNGDTRLGMRKMARCIAASVAAGVLGFITASDDQLRADSIVVRVQCDDFGTIDDEHVDCITDTVRTGTPEEMEACNVRLRACARPARGFRASDQVEVYGEQKDAEDGDAAS